jgi:hypothetical protein
VAGIIHNLSAQTCIDWRLVLVVGRRECSGLRRELGRSGWREEGKQRFGSGGTARQRNGADKRGKRD